ncbi:MAG: helix-turn-helix transcriptional regulator [Fimbriimonadaceae bacterium]|nr:helix-turn-helix transcriptional regulator [Fimbriimonadaceae bacterium]
MDLGSRDGRSAQGRRIQAAAEAAGLSLAELARRIGCSRALIYQYVAGQVLAQPDRLQTIADACGRPLAWFYTTSDEPPAAAARDAELERLRQELAAARQAWQQRRGQDVVEQLTALAEAQGSPVDYAAQRRTCERLAERVAELGDEPLLAAAELRLGNCCHALGDFEATRAALSRAVDRFRRLGDGAGERSARQTLGAALAGLGERDRALAEFDQVIAGGGFAWAWRGHLGRADVFEALGRGEAALAELQAAADLLAAAPAGPEREWAALYLAGATANVYLLHDDFAAAQQSATQMIPLAEELACLPQHLEAKLNLGYAARQRGHWATAQAALDEAARLARLTGDRERAAVALALLADLDACLGRLDSAKARGKDALAAALALGALRGEVLAQAALSEAYRRSGEGHEALYHAQQGLAAAQGHQLVKTTAQLRVAAARARRLLGDAGALADARRAAAEGEALGARWVQAAAALELAALEADPRQAAEHLAAGTALAAAVDGWELIWAATVAAAAGGDLTAAETVWRRLLAQQDRLLEDGLEVALLEDQERLTAGAACLSILRAGGAAELAAELQAAAAWPPLDELLAAAS